MVTAYSIEDGEFMYGDLHWNAYTSSQSSVAFYPDPYPDPYVRITAAGYMGYAGIWQQETKMSQGYTKAVFDIQNVSVGLNCLITVGWTNIDGEFDDYWLDVTSPGIYEVICSNPSYPFVTVQADSSYIVNAIVWVDSIEVKKPGPTPTPTSTPTPTPTDTPTPTSTPTPTPTPSPTPTPEPTPTPTPTPEPTPSLTPSPYGEDFDQMHEHVLGYEEIAPEDFKIFDVNQDGVIDVADLIWEIIHQK